MSAFMRRVVRHRPEKGPREDERPVVLMMKMMSQRDTRSITNLQKIFYVAQTSCFPAVS